MLEDDAYCADIFTQSSAVKAALDAFNRELLVNHFNHCVIEDVKNDNIANLDEFKHLLRKLVK